MEDLFVTSHLRVKGAWKCLWRLKIPQKIKLLLWRVARGVLPTRSNLLRRNVMCDNHCPMCDGNPENEWHAFFDYIHAEAIWVNVGCFVILSEPLKHLRVFVNAFQVAASSI